MVLVEAVARYYSHFAQSAKPTDDRELTHLPYDPGFDRTSEAGWITIQKT